MVGAVATSIPVLEGIREPLRQLKQLLSGTVQLGEGKALRSKGHIAAHVERQDGQFQIDFREPLIEASKTILFRFDGTLTGITIPDGKNAEIALDGLPDQTFPVAAAIGSILRGFGTLPATRDLVPGVVELFLPKAVDLVIRPVGSVVRIEIQPSPREASARCRLVIRTVDPITVYPTAVRIDEQRAVLETNILPIPLEVRS